MTGTLPASRSRPERPSARLDIAVEPGGWAGLLGLLATHARGRAVYLHLRGEAAASWPSDEELGQLVALGSVEVEVPWALRLGESQPEASAHFIRFLRDSMSHGLKVGWRGGVEQTLPGWLLSHLEPPAADSGQQLPALDSWREGHSYGRCYWRAGPGFILVKDCRAGREAARFSLQEPPLLQVFTALALPRRVEEVAVDEATEQALADLMQEQLVLRLGDWALTLPYRMRRWPIPFSAI